MRLLIAFLILFPTSCIGQAFKKCNSYYFLMRSFLNEQTYIYVNQRDTSDKAIWKMKATINGEDTLFETTIFNAGKLTEKVTERVKNGNSILIKYEIYRDGKSAICTILDSLVYRCNQAKNETIGWRVTYQDPVSAMRWRLTKKRTLKHVNGKQQVFIDSMKLSVLDEARSYEYVVRFVYEKIKGLVSYSIITPNNPIKDYILVAVK